MSTNQFYSELHQLIVQARGLATTGYKTPKVENEDFVFPTFNQEGVNKPEILSRPQVDKPKPIEIENIANIAMLNQSIDACVKCGLHKNRSKSVPGAGVQKPRILVIGDFPGFDEDQTGRAYVGEAGVFLDKWLESISLSRYENTYITNLIKCRPMDQNLNTGVTECATWLDYQITLLKPEAILVLGHSVARVLFKSNETLDEYRAKSLSYKNLPAVVTFTPKEVLIKTDLKRPVWEDLKKLKLLLEKRA